MTYRKKLIEVDLPLDAINAEAAREKSIRHGHPSTLHLWWARRPLAACRAVLFGQLVDDPSAWPELFTTEEEQKRERERLFEVIRELVKWENSNSGRVLNAARLEIAHSVARGRKADGEGDSRDDAILAAGVQADDVNRYLAEVAPPVYDPFAGGGSIPLEAQRLGLRAYASDLNPVAVMINKALIEIPPKFAGRAPINPKSRRDLAGGWEGAQGLAEDVRFYGEWMRDEAFRRIGHLYPKVQLPKEHGGGEATVIAWLWARTVASPNPAFRDVQVPLVPNFFLSTKPGKETWMEPVVGGRGYHLEIRHGKPEDPERIKQGTKLGRGASFRCVMSGVPIEPQYVKSEGRAGRMGMRLMALVAEGGRSRVYLAPTKAMENIVWGMKPDRIPDQRLPDNPRWFSPPDYGMPTYGDLFTPRQLVALTTFSDLVLEARERVRVDARSAGWSDDGRGLETGGDGATGYADAMAVYLACATSKAVTRNCTLALWEPGMGRLAGALGRQALAMTWSFAETNPLAGAGGDIAGTARSVSEVLDSLPHGVVDGCAKQRNAMAVGWDTADGAVLIATDPPYYDNIGYADLSDFFYVWLRPILGRILEPLFSTILSPKSDELIAAPYRYGGRDNARSFFLTGMGRALTRMSEAMPPDLPVLLFYAFKQSESEDGGAGVSTGWETFLASLVGGGLVVDATWPVRTELTSALKKDVSALASSIVLVCRKRPDNAPTITRPAFRRLLRQELPAALKVLQNGHIAPVDMAQATIGPGMEIFSRHKAVLDANDKPMAVRDALILINEALDEYLSEQDGEMDSTSRFALTWFEANGFKAGDFGEAETLAKARNVSVEAVAAAGILRSAAGKVRLLSQKELAAGWDPAHDGQAGAWGAVHHLIKRLNEQSEDSAAGLLARLGSLNEQARGLAYRLYSICDRKGWAEEARDYNGLVTAWPELETLAAASHSAVPAAEQTTLPVGP